jgi:hypothetical protein
MEFRGEMGDGSGQRMMKCDMCTKHVKEGSCWERQSEYTALKFAEVRNMARHVLRIALVLHAVGVRAALMQLVARAAQARPREATKLREVIRPKVN